MNTLYESGKVINGTVSGIADYGIFVNFEKGYSGMIHISEVSNNFVKNINDYAKLGEKIPCKILEIDYKTKKLRLSIKNLEYHIQRNEFKNKEFYNLKNMLPIWIQEKLKEIDEVEKYH